MTKYDYSLKVINAEYENVLACLDTGSINSAQFDVAAQVLDKMRQLVLQQQEFARLKKERKQRRLEATKLWKFKKLLRLV